MSIQEHPGAPEVQTTSRQLYNDQLWSEIVAAMQMSPAEMATDNIGCVRVALAEQEYYVVAFLKY